MAKTTSMTTEVVDALNAGKRGCTLCSMWEREEASLIDTIRREGAPASSELRGKLIASSGFCNRHTHVIHKSGSGAKPEESFGDSACAQIVLKKLEDDLTALLADIKSGKASADPAIESERNPLPGIIGKLEKTINGDSMCPVCQTLLESDKQRMSGLLPMLESKDLAELYGKSDGMCVPHYVTAMKVLHSATLKNVEAVWSLLVKTELARLTAVDNVLNERMEKYAWDSRSEGITKEEAGAQMTGALQIVGVEGLYCRTRKTSLRPAREK